MKARLTRVDGAIEVDADAWAEILKHAGWQGSLPTVIDLARGRQLADRLAGHCPPEVLPYIRGGCLVSYHY